MDDAPTLHPYHYADAYHRAGWHPLELPAGEKGPPPEGLTGYSGVDLDAEAIAGRTWLGNIGLRMPADVIGLDVDAYRGGSDTLAGLIAECGPLPRTWISHSGRNDGSGIRFYRVPPGMAWITSLPGLDVIQRTHRYAAVFPSQHPDGRRYGWWDQSEQAATDGVPLVENLPELPWPWIAALSRATQDDTVVRSSAVAADEAETFLKAHDRADAPSYVLTIVKHFQAEVTAGRSRHDSMQHCLTWAMESVRAGLLAAYPTLSELGTAWEAVHTDPRRQQLWNPTRTTEFDAMLRHSIGKVQAKPDAELAKLHDEVAGVTMNVPEPVSAEVVDDYHPSVLIDWREFANRDATDRPWLVEAFWPSGRSMALWASAKQGKSELALWCAAKLAMGQHPWTGDPLDPVDVLYLDYEMTEDDLAERLDDFGFDPDDLGHLHYALLPAIDPLDSPRGGEQVLHLAQSVGAEAVIVDTFGRAVDGDENEADTVRAFYRHTGMKLKAEGIGVLRTDHAGKDKGKGQRGSSAKRDDVDVVWSLARAQGGVLLDCSASTRLSWVGPTLKLDRLVTAGIVSYSAPMRIGWPAGTAAKAAELDALGLPLDVGRPAAKAALKAAAVAAGGTEHGAVGSDKVLQAALKYRRDPSLHQGEQPVDNSGSVPGSADLYDPEVSGGDQ